ncbi:hypothetical protein ACHAWX_004555 [Stephanocyclus meneghinianus]
MVDKRMQHLRHRLCAAIALNPTATENDAPQLFEFEAGEQFDDAVDAHSNDVNNSQQPLVCGNSSNVTPLIMACDKSHSAALVYLRSQLEELHSEHHYANRDDSSKKLHSSMRDLVELWGHPAESSSTSEGANTAAHHALAAGFSFGLDVLEYFSNRCSDDVLSSTPKEPLESSRLHIFHSLISRSNANGDTPIMMACVFGHTALIEHVLEKCLELAINGLSEASHNQLGKLEDSFIEELWRPIQDIFAMRNKEGCSALNLSCGHGHVDIVHLISRPLHVKASWTDKTIRVIILHDNDTNNTNEARNLSSEKHVQILSLKPLVATSFRDAEFCKESLENLDSEVKFMKQQQNKVDKFKLDEFIEQSRKIRECGEVLNAELNRISDAAIKELMNDDGITAHLFTPGQHVSKKNKKKKSKGTSKPKQKIVSSTTGQEVSSSYSENEWQAVQTGNQCTNRLLTNESPFSTLQDGCIISKTQQRGCIETMNSDETSIEATVGNRASQSLQKVLQSRLLRHTHPKEDTPLHNQIGIDIEAKMESLCLDPSMLLLTPHGMAMEMSPCQLEAMQAILEHQYNATIEAQRIQTRLLSERKDG